MKFIIIFMLFFCVLNTQAFLFGSPLTFELIQNMGINDLIAAKLQAILNFFNLFCIPLPSWLQEPEITSDQIRFKFFRPCTNVSEPVMRSRQLLSRLNSTKITWIHFFGFQSDVTTSSDIYTIWQQLACRTDEFNFIAVDMSNSMKGSYARAVLNIQPIANFVAQGIRLMFNAPNRRRIQANRIIMSGHSLGAHIAGLTGRRFRQLTGRRIKRIIALDPASPCVESNPNTTLSATDAEIVDVLHGNNGLLGVRRPMGTSDFYPDGVGMLPGGSANARIAHDLPVKLLAESIVKRNSMNFPSYKCSSLVAIEQGRCVKKSGNQMGYASNSNKRGIFFVPINKKAPFGKGAGKRRANWLSNKCHICGA